MIGLPTTAANGEFVGANVFSVIGVWAKLKPLIAEVACLHDFVQVGHLRSLTPKVSWRRKERSDWREPKSEAFWRQLDRPVRPNPMT
jgi:hypothetical protein